MNHVLEEILRDWATKAVQVKALQEELDKARLTAQEYLRGQENRRAECEELKRELAIKNRIVGELKHELNASRDARELARRLEEAQSLQRTIVNNVYAPSPDMQGREA